MARYSSQSATGGQLTLPARPLLIVVCRSPRLCYRGPKSAPPQGTHSNGLLMGAAAPRSIICYRIKSDSGAKIVARRTDTAPGVLYSSGRWFSEKSSFDRSNLLPAVRYAVRFSPSSPHNPGRVPKGIQRVIVLAPVDEVLAALPSR